MREYFQLQFKRSQRIIVEFGVPSIIGYVLLGLLFIGLSFLIFERAIYPPLIYSLLAFLAIISIDTPERTIFLKNNFNQSQFRAIRIIENIILVTPFIIFLFAQGNWMHPIIILPLAILTACFSFNIKLRKTMPTPFGGMPFEFLIGFRKTILIIILIAFVLAMAISVNNFNLALAMLLSTFLLSMTYYSILEERYFVWLFSDLPSTFLIQKVKTAIMYATLLSLPFAVTLFYFFTDRWTTVLLIICLGYLYVVCAVLVKYASYPKSSTVANSILYAVSIVLPPLLLITIPYFYYKGVHNLKTDLI